MIATDNLSGIQRFEGRAGHNLAAGGDGERLVAGDRRLGAEGVDDADRPRRDLAAGGAAATGLVLEEPLELGAEVDNAGGVIEENEAAAAQTDGFRFAEGLRLECNVESGAGHDAQQGTPGLEGLHRPSRGRAAAADL